MNGFHHKKELIFLDGPQSRWQELKFLISVMVEFVKGLRALHFLGPCATIFGSARFTEENPYYQKAVELGKEMALLGFTVLTGGGPGIMEAANRGAKQVDGKSVGCNIVLPQEQKPNPYLDKWVNIKYFFVRKTLLIKYSYTFIIMPGGFGTLDEFYETLTLIQTQKLQNFPIVVFGTEFHKDILEHNENMLRNKTISPEDLHLFLVTDSIEETVAFIKEKTIQFGLKPKIRQPKWWLFEK